MQLLRRGAKELCIGEREFTTLSDQRPRDKVFVVNVVECRTQCVRGRVRWLLEEHRGEEPLFAIVSRGRTNVLRWLAEHQAPLARPERIQLRDGQIYRWMG
jgi:hypothetical protein